MGAVFDIIGVVDTDPPSYANISSSDKVLKNAEEEHIRKYLMPCEARRTSYYSSCNIGRRCAGVQIVNEPLLNDFQRHYISHTV